MGKMLPVDTTEYWNSTDIVCCVCGKAFGGLVYDPDNDIFVHRTDDECVRRKGKVLSSLNLS